MFGDIIADVVPKTEGVWFGVCDWTSCVNRGFAHKGPVAQKRDRLHKKSYSFRFRVTDAAVSGTLAGMLRSYLLGSQSFPIYSIRIGEGRACVNG
jgi:hypothetical protein